MRVARAIASVALFLALAGGGVGLANGEHPEPRLGDFREGVVMTRFFSHLCLTAGDDGSLVPFAEELPDPIASETGDG